MFTLRLCRASSVTGQRTGVATDYISARYYAKKDKCRKALVDLPKPKICSDVCPKPCNVKRKKRFQILHKIKMHMVEGGTNFGTPFRRLLCRHDQKDACKKEEPKEPEKDKPSPAPPKKAVAVPMVPDIQPGVQVTILGADTLVGQYMSLLLKQCRYIKKLRLYETKDTRCTVPGRNLCAVAEDLRNINTNCRVQAYSCLCGDLERSLQNADIVVILESGYINVDMPLEKRLAYQAPIVKQYADAISLECPKAFVVVCSSPIDCMVPIVVETLKETGWYNPRKVLGSLAVPEMRASTMAAQALYLEPRYTRVPCIGGTEGETLVPLFSKAVEYFAFNEKNAEMLTYAVRAASCAQANRDGSKNDALSEAHALSKLIMSIGAGLVCHGNPIVSGFVETDPSQVISPARFIGSPLELDQRGIKTNLGLPKMTNMEMGKVDIALNVLCERLCMAYNWYTKYCCSSGGLDQAKFDFFVPGRRSNIDDCAYANF